MNNDNNKTNIEHIKLLDCFAAAALQGYIAEGNVASNDTLAKLSYDTAEAIMTERKARKIKNNE